MAIKEQLALRQTMSKVGQLRIQSRLRKLENEEIKIQKALAKALKDEGIE